MAAGIEDAALEEAHIASPCEHRTGSCQSTSFGSTRTPSGSADPVATGAGTPSSEEAVEQQSSRSGPQPELDAHPCLQLGDEAVKSAVADDGPILPPGFSPGPGGPRATALERLAAARVPVPVAAQWEDPVLAPESPPVDERALLNTLDVAVPECPICMSFLCEPLTAACGHAFCRVCILQSTRMSPAGRSCPLCRSKLDITNPVTHPVNEDLEAAVLCAVSRGVYDSRVQQAQEQLAALQEKARTQLPVFFMHPGTTVGATIALHFFEPRYRVLIRRAWEGNHLFVYCASSPRRGLSGIIVRVDAAQFLPDGRANIVGQGIRTINLGETWVEEGTSGLYYTKIGNIPRGDEPGHDPEFGQLATEDRLSMNGLRMSPLPPRCPGCACSIM